MAWNENFSVLFSRKKDGPALLICQYPHLFHFFVAWRLIAFAVVQTWYVPDEYWQSLEVAHNIVFGYGYLTWEWILGIRSYIHPLIVASIYKFLQLTNLDSSVALFTLPKVFQAILSAYADLCFWHWSGMRKWAFFNIITAWFWFYTCTRTLINTFETCITMIALSAFPWKGTANNANFLWLVALICCVRPTAAIHWLPLCIYHLIVSKETVFRLILKKYLPIGLVALLLTTAIDSYAHGSFIITSYEFLKVNVFNNVGEWYGTQPWHWYLSAGLPAILGIQLIPFILATINIIRYRYMHQNELALLGCIVFSLTIYSCLNHKEFRFILPLLPVTLHISAGYLAQWSSKANKILVWFVAMVMLIANAIPAMYLSTIHQRGSIDVMYPLQNIAQLGKVNTSFLFLMPCHSTPLYSHMHVNVSTRFLTCEPNLSRKDTYVDEADQFYKDPQSWLRKNYPPSGPFPSHLIMFNSLAPFVEAMTSRYKEIHKFFHTNIPSGRVGQYILVFERDDF